MRRIDNLRIQAVRPLIPPAILAEELPVPEKAAEFIYNSRQQASEIVRDGGRRLLVICGPCSIHDPEAALEYGVKLKNLAERYSDDLFIVMRVYFEKPRTIVGWKGLINDPDLDESYHINKGLRIARRLLLDFASLGIPAATEFLDVMTPQHIADLVTWGAIGARTTESQVHRELASGLSMPVGFKNATDGDAKVAVEAVLAAQSPHWFPSITKEGISAISESIGNDCCHVILRGGSKTGPNYEAEHVQRVSKMLVKAGLRNRVMVDCSHGNSGKDYLRQPAVASDVASQLRDGSKEILGVMVESHLVEGRQDLVQGQMLAYGQSITDSCLSLEQTEPVLEELARSV